MNDLALHIEYLLLSHDCVIVPGLGAFLAHSAGAYADSETGAIYPPSRSLGFNADLTHNDGLLAGSVARRGRISIDAALAEVERTVASFLRQLAEARCLPVGEIGELSIAPDNGTLIFSPSASSLPVSLPALGLPEVRMTPLAADGDPGVDEVVVPARRTPLRRVAVAVASVIAVILCLGVMLTRDSVPGYDSHYFASMNHGLGENVSRIVTPAEVEDSVPLSRYICLNIAAPVPEVQPEISAPALGRYLLVVGSFPSQSGAAHFVGKDRRLGVIEMDGNYRVYASSARTYTEARAKADDLSTEFPAVWICRR